MDDSPSYDVFLSYSRDDDQAAEKLAGYLTDVGIRVFFDRWALVPGSDWQASLDKALQSSAALVLLISPSKAVSTWREKESQSADSAGKRIIPVLLPGAKPEKIPAFLKERVYVDFHKGMDDPQALNRLIASLEAVGTPEIINQEQQTGEDLRRDGDPAGALPHFKRALKIAKAVYGEENVEVSNLLSSIAGTQADLGLLLDARSSYEQALAIAQEIGDRTNEGILLGNLVYSYGDLGQTDKAIEYSEQALKIAREIGDQHTEGIMLGNLGNSYSDLGQTDKAIEYTEQALAIAREIGDRRDECLWLGNLGLSYSDLGQTDKAVKHIEQALAIAREIGDRRNEGTWLGSLGNSYSDLGQTDKAIEYYEQALAIARQIGDRRSEGLWLGDLGLSYRDLGQSDKAIEYYEQALSMAHEIGDRGSEGSWLGDLGLSYRDLGQKDKAIERYEQALAIARQIGDRRNEGTWLCDLGYIAIDQGNYAKALDLARESVRISDEIGALGSYTNGLLAEVFFYSGDLLAAHAAAEISLSFDEPLNNPDNQALLGLIALRQNDREASRQAFTRARDLANELLVLSPQNYQALAIKALSLCGLAFVTEDAATQQDLLEAAIEAYQAARTINKDPGIVRFDLRRLDALMEADTRHAELLTRARAVASQGSEMQ